MRNLLVRVSLVASLFAAALGLHAGCGPSSLQLGLKEEEVRVARIAVYAGGAETRTAAPLGVKDHLVVEALALNAQGDPVRNEAVAFASTDEGTVKVLSTWGAWPRFYAALRGELAGTAEVVCSAGTVASWITVPVSETAAGGSRPYLRFVAPDATPIPVDGSRIYAAEYVNANGTTGETSLVFTLSNATVAKIASSDRSSVTLTGLATGEVSLFARDAANTAAAGLTLSVR